MKFGIGAKIAALLIVLVCATAGVLIWRLWGVSREIVIKHEVGDLNDETKLRAREIQSQLYVARREVLNLGRDKALQAYLAGPQSDPDALTRVCLKYYGGPTQNAFLRFEIWQRGKSPDTAPMRIAPLESVQRVKSLDKAGEVVSELVGAEPLQPYLSDVQYTKVHLANEPAPRRVHLVWSGVRVPRTGRTEGQAESAGELYVIAAMNLDADLPNGDLSPLFRLSTSPRHLAFLVSEPPLGKQASDPVDPESISPLLFCVDDSKQEHIDLAPLKANFAKLYEQRRSLNELDNFVQTLLPKASSTFARDNELKLKQPLWFMQSAAIDDVDLRAAIADALEAEVPKWNEEHSGVRIGGVRNTVTNIRILAHSEKDLADLSQRINDTVKDVSVAGKVAAIDWNAPVRCQECFIHYALFPVRSSKSQDGLRYYGLAYAAFREEMMADVDRELSNLIVPSVLVVCGVALVGFIASFVFTRPLQKITAVAESVGRTKIDPDPNDDRWQNEIDSIVANLPDGRRDEIGVLARAFKQMIGAVVQGHQRLRRLNADLDQRVQARTSELEGANEQLKAARDKAHELNLAKDAFLASVSHELRNPLNQVSGFCQLLELTELDDDQLADLSKIQRASEQLLALINDILDYQKIVMGGLALEPEEFEVGELLKEVGDAMEFPSRENNNTLQVECDDDVGTMDADKQRIRQVLINLSGNACKFTNEGTVSVRARRMPRDGVDQIVFTVEDTGRGMTPEEQSKLFTPFTKLAAKQGNRTGTGLGLVISKGFCELMNGGIELESEFGKGTKFTVHIPAGTERPGELSQTTDDNAGVASRLASNSETPAGEIPAVLQGLAPTNGKVLVIDDDADVRELMTRYLGSQGFDIATAANGIEGLQMAKELKPTVITLDAIMPGLDGWAVLAALKADAETADIPVVMVTMVDNQQRGEVMGAAEFIVKPIVWGQLARVLAKYTGEQRDRTVLVVDDDATHRDLMRRNLERDGWEVVEAEHGRAALEILETHKPAAILLDLIMPVMDGFEFLAELSKLDEARQIPVIVVTAKDPTPEETERLQRGRVRVMQKGSHSQEELLREIHRRLDRLAKTSATSQGEGAHAQDTHR